MREGSDLSVVDGIHIPARVKREFQLAKENLVIIGSAHSGRGTDRSLRLDEHWWLKGVKCVCIE